MGPGGTLGPRGLGWASESGIATPIFNQCCIPKQRYLQHVADPHKFKALIAPEAIRIATLVVIPAHSYERAAPRAPPIHGTWHGFGDTVNHNSQANLCQHIVVFVVNNI